MTRKASPRCRSAISNTPPSTPLKGLALSDLPPSAAIVSALNMSPCTSSGNSSKSLRAALIHEMGRVSLIPLMLANLSPLGKPFSISFIALFDPQRRSQQTCAEPWVHGSARLPQLPHKRNQPVANPLHVGVVAFELPDQKTL